MWIVPIFSLNSIARVSGGRLFLSGTCMFSLCHHFGPNTAKTEDFITEGTHYKGHLFPFWQRHPVHSPQPRETFEREAHMKRDGEWGKQV